MFRDEKEVLGVTDYVVLAIMLVVSSLIGIYYRFTGGKQKTRQAAEGLSINDVTVLGGGGLGFCDESTRPLVTKT